MKAQTKWYLTLVFGFLALIGAGQVAAANAKYTVYCANGKIEIDSRSLEQMKAARGNNVCVLADFTALGDAEKYASQQGGKGSPCKCR
ncbi:MAG: hypothetical protein K1Y36_02345 [Blastocatellia bacterium]|nr:hypothetical protein [Blastocatellia bacterium]